MKRNVCDEITKEFNELSKDWVKEKDKAVKLNISSTTKRYLSKCLTPYCKIRTGVNIAINDILY